LIIEDKEEAIETLKQQVEDFERELLGLQEQIAHVMKLNQEIGAASEHWEKSYQEAVEANQEALIAQEQDYSSMQKQLTERINQFKRKIGNKDMKIKDLTRQFEEANSIVEQQN
jgi:predicted phage tail protein